MLRFERLLPALALCAATVLLTPTASSAQLRVSGGAGGGFAPGAWGGPIGPLGVPFYTPNFRYGQSLNVRVGTPFGPSIGYRQSYYGAAGWWLSNNKTAISPRYNIYPNGPGWPSNNPSGFLGGPNTSMSGGYNPVLANAQQNLGAAQRQNAAGYASPGGARAAIDEQRNIENRLPGQVPAALPANAPRELLDALTVADEGKLMTGEYLNRLAAEITSLEARGARGTPAQLGPPLLAQVRFGGSPSGDALNVIRRAGALEFPAAFESVESLRALRTTLEQNLVAASSPTRIGKPADPQKAVKLEDDVRKANALLTPALNALPFDEATAARRFLNQLEAAAKVLRDPKSAGLVNPSWDTGGVNVSDLVKHMAKFKVFFGRCEPGDEEAYLTVHHALAGYLFELQQNEPKKK